MQSLKEYYLYPGSLFAHSQPHLVSTILGSCVAVCIWDPVMQIGGINHYQLPLWNGNGLASPKYGNIAITKLVEKMINLGSKREDLKAKVFGGANVIAGNNGGISVGTKNILVAKDVLQKENISIISSNLGGHLGRKLKFNTQTGVVLMKFIKNGSNGNGKETSS